MQASLRAAGVPADVINAPYEGVAGGPPTEAELEDFVERYLDPADPDTNHPVLATGEDELFEIMPWDGSHPKHCIIGPDRDLLWCKHGHGYESKVEGKVLDLWEAAQ